ncbi:hypothetical protein E2N92_07780 [Methanofollis formosanus]|uniref:S-layer protein n=1 Tax=Methanofollis formosanus TaxID=299308 RepID=A0A8G1EG07_9EURY|nr:hypothetical protein [Methanofollis formosanus]QYZ79333.1 hypothetical protein E2N92_07780 [Methanofollis formosanus]
MRTLWICFAVFLLLLPAAAAAVDGEENAARVTVLGTQTDPTVLMPGDEATVSVTIKNTANQSVPISSARLYTDKNVAVLDSPYQTFGAIGPGNEATFTFRVKASLREGIFYPVFVLDFRDAGSLRYPVPVKVDGTEPRFSVISRPDSFVKDKKEIVRVSVSNPRPGPINGVSVVPSGQNLEVTPTSAFIGALEPDQAGEVAFNITPAEETDLIFTLRYRNGDNQRSIEVPLPIVFSEDKKRAEIVVSGVEVTTEGGHYRASGDVTNAGLEVAKAVVITTGAPAMPVDPNRVYPVASLDPDDLANFDVTFRVENATEIPLVIEYKDVDGNTYSSTAMIGVSSTLPAPGEGETTSFPTTAVVLVLVVAVIAGAVIFYSWKKAKENEK